MKRILLFVGFLLVGATLWALDVLESKIIKKEVREVVGNGALSVSAETYLITLQNGNATVSFALPKSAFDLMHEGDLVRVTYDKGLFEPQLKGIKMLRSAENPAN